MEKNIPTAKGGIAVAVSGGGDSMALAVLMQGWAADKGLRLLALTVDHGLRPESRAEAETTGRVLSARGIEHKILTWSGVKPVSHLQEKARQARYELLHRACESENISTLAVAHNLEDQIETFWMRLAHGSGLDGLSGMSSVREAKGLRIIRPLLDVSRADLRAFCGAEKISYIDDPSNQDRRFLRVRLRAVEDTLAAEGLTPERLSQTLKKLGDAREALEWAADQAAAQALRLHDAGYVTIMAEVWRAQPLDIRRRLLRRAISFVAPAENYAPGFDALDRICGQKKISGQTLWGCDVFESGSEIFIAREAAAIAPPMLLSAEKLWDGRFQVRGPRLENLRIGALGAAEISTLRKKLAEQEACLQAYEALHPKVRPTLPAIFSGENIMSVPHLSWISGDAAPDVRALKIVQAISGTI